MLHKPLLIKVPGARLAATVSLPDGACRGAIVLLHPAGDPSRHQFLFAQLGTVLPALGVAVLRYDRRAAAPGQDVPYDVQAEDCASALAVLAAETGPVPAGLWGFSQGAWAALVAASGRAGIAFLILVGCSAVSPARQMRYGTAEQLRRAGYGPEALAGLDDLRRTWESYQRGQADRGQAQAVVDSYAGRDWFGLSWVPRRLPPTPGWQDMDFDPAPLITRVRCPVLLFYGQDEWVPVRQSIATWRHGYTGPRLDIRELPGTGHYPVLGGRQDMAAISPEYTATLTGWLAEVLAAGRHP